MYAVTQSSMVLFCISTSLTQNYCYRCIRR